MIRNTKTIDPRDAASPVVYQLETAMGAAIELFADAAAVRVPRLRFAAVKKTGDLLGIRSDAYVLTDDFRIVPNPRADARRDRRHPRRPLLRVHRPDGGALSRAARRRSSTATSSTWWATCASDATSS